MDYLVVDENIYLAITNLDGINNKTNKKNH